MSNSASVQRRVAVAVSGGRDSMSLLHATHAAAAELGIEVWALHVHHGLQPQADDWVTHIEQMCRRWSAAQSDAPPIVFRHRHLRGRPAKGRSVEEWARTGRYQALDEMLKEAGIDLLLLAQHQRDQAETFLLQALRGGGPAGLASMPKHDLRNGVLWCRPWLDHPWSAVEHYARSHHIAHVQDPSNEDIRWARNRLRLRVLPTLLDSFPEAEAALAQAARHAAVAQAALDEAAWADLQSCVQSSGTLVLKELLRLSQAKRWQVLRLWLRRQAQMGPPTALVERLLAEWPQCSSATWEWPGLGVLRSYRGGLRFEKSSPVTEQLTAGLTAPPPVELSFHRAGRKKVVAWSGSLVVRRAREGELALNMPMPLSLLLRPREGGDSFQFSARSTARALKKQFQSRAVAAWERLGPVVCLQASEARAPAQLVYVPGLGMDARLCAPARDDTSAWVVEWEAHGSSDPKGGA